MAKPSLQRVAIGFSVIASTPARGDLDHLLRMQPARRGQRHAIGLAAGEQRGQRVETLRLRGLHRGIQGHRVGVAHRHQFGVAGMAADGIDVALRDAPATDQGKTQLAVDDGRAAGLHGWGLRSAITHQQIIADAPLACGPLRRGGPPTSA